MTYVVTQSCCSDASCVTACPVNCIHPAPGEPGFAEAEMLYVDPVACMDCGACTTACPVGAVVPHTALGEHELPFLELNAAYYREHPHDDRPPLAPVRPLPKVTARRPVRVAVVGAGPAGLFTADELLRQDNIEVDVFDRLPTPYGLVRAGVAPDHARTKDVTRLFERIEDQAGFRYVLGVEVGTDITHEELRAAYDAVVHASGSGTGRTLDLPGSDLADCVTATDVVAWYNGHPDHRELPISLDAERVLVVGNGNVALDVARILTADPDRLARTDIADHALAALRGSAVREVVVLGRRGPADAAFSLPELVGLAGLTEVDVVVDAGGPVEATTEKTKVLAALAERQATEGRRRIVLRFRTTPVEVLGAGHVQGMAVSRDGATEEIAAGAVVAAIGYRARPVEGLPFDHQAGRVPSDQGRVEPGVYVAGWIKRGPRGFIGTNRSCAEETAARVFEDLDAGRLSPPTRPRPTAPVDLAGWRAIDEHERTAGRATDRVRVKLTDTAAMRAVAAG
ncbi:FAD-dependent oxidoreductase [Nocardioides pelophilus]|uniref:FAD-dependent oxidoreductase n=1 Tax=Nocardioides pelophilus TaxID=2172019 RepID=UPI0016023A85|nr:FAD-dependent oxidoreductase [Nocardioides pelophilus]